MAFAAREQLANIPVVARETARLAQMFRAWGPDDWQRPTYCAGWTAADAVAHLATGGNFYAQVLTSGRQGQPTLPWGATNLAEFRAARQEAGAQLLAGGPAALCHGFEQGGARLQTVLESLHAADLAKVAQHPRGLVPIGAWVGMRLMELGVHEWDIRQPHGEDVRLAAPLVPVLLGVMPEIQLQFLEQRLTGQLDGVYALQAGELSWGLTIQDKAVAYQASLPSAPTVRYHTDAESMIMLTVGRLTIPEALQRGVLTITGDVAQGHQLSTMLFRAF